MFARAGLPILISGAGIAGQSLARQCRKFGIPFKIIERKTELTTEGAGIALPANAVKALRRLGLGHQIDATAHRVNSIIYTDSKGNVLSNASLLKSPLNVDHFTALHRSQFHKILQEKPEEIHFDTRITAINQSDDHVTVQFDNPDIKQKKFSAVIGADGINSRVRELVFGPNLLTDLELTTWRWVCTYSTDNLQPTYMLDLHNVFMAYPISKNEVYCYAHTFDPKNIFSTDTDHHGNLSQQFCEYGGVAATLLNLLPDNHLIIPGRLRSVFPPLFSLNRVALIGDAGHVCSPLLQQGAAAALEDVIALTELLRCFPVKTALLHYKHFRTERVQWTAQSSDTPLRMLANMTPAIASAIQQKIRENGPLNVQGWNQLLSTDPISEISTYIRKSLSQTDNSNHKTLHF